MIGNGREKGKFLNCFSEMFEILPRLFLTLEAVRLPCRGLISNFISLLFQLCGLFSGFVHCLFLIQ